jgi:hypothetical protein
MSQYSVYLQKDTCFVDAINYMRKQGFETSVMILKVAYERLKLEKHLNEIGAKILCTTGEPIEVATIIQGYAVH